MAFFILGSPLAGLFRFGGRVATDNRKIQLEVGAENKTQDGFESVKRDAAAMAQSVAQSAGGAAKAVGGIGDGAADGAQKLDRSTKSIISSVQRATAAMEAGERGTAKYFETLAGQRGANVDALKPYLEQLKQAERSQQVATGSLDKMGVSAKQTAAALRGVPAQFTDIITSLQGGQAPLTVLLQQGGQLKDMFGGVGNAAKALGGYVVGLINPFTLAAAAVGGIAVAYMQGSKEADAYRTALITTGNAAGTNAAQLKSYAQEISGIVGTQGKAAESLAALASTGKVGAESLRDAAKAAVEYERAGVQAIGKTAEQFASLRNEPLAAVLKLNDGMNFLTDSTYKQIKSLDEQGRTAEAANVAQRAFADTLSGRAGEMERNLGTVERGWIAVKDAAKSAWDAILNVGRASTSVDQLSDVRKQIAARENQLANDGFGSNGGGAAFGRPSSANSARLSAEITALKAQAAALEGVAFASKTAAEAERQRGESVKASAAFDKAGERFLTDKVKMERELAVARTQGAEAGRSQAEIEKRLGEIRASYAKKGGSGVAAENKELRDQQRIFAELAGVSSTYYAELANAQKQRAAGVITEQQYVTAVQSLIEKQPFAVALAKEEAAATQALSKSYAEAAAERIKTIQSMERAADSLQSQNDALREEIELIGLSTEQQTLVLQQRNDVIILTKEATLAELERQSAITGTQTRVEIALASEIAALKERNALLGAKGVKNAAVDAAKSAADEWQKTTDSINQSLTDSLLRGFESGKDFAKNLRDTVINMFKTMVLRPVISAIVNPVAGAVTGMMGLSGPAQGGGNSVMGGIQTASNLNTLWGAGSQALFGGTAGASAASLGYANIVGMAGGDAIGALAAANGMWAGVATGAQAAAQAAIASNAAMAAGTAAALPAGTTAAAAGAGAAGAAGASTGAMGALSAIPVWGWALAAVAAIAALWDDGSGTLHTGAKAQYSAADGLATTGEGGKKEYGLNVGMVYDKNTADFVGGVAKGLTETFDGLAVAFGQKAGYQVATAFADDTSKDGAWGALRISKDGKDLLNWEDTRTSRWAPREFADGEAGQKEYLAAIAKDTRTVLLDMDLPSWADTILESIGDAANMEQLSATLQQIGVIQTTFVQLGKTMEGFAGLTDKAFEALMRASGGFESLAANAGTYYENFYSEAEKTAAVTRSVSESLAQVGLAMPATRDEFRALVESQFSLGESGAEAVAALLGVSGAFASVVPAAAEATASLQAQAEAMEGLQIKLLRAQGDELAAVAIERQKELAALQDFGPAAVAMQQQIYGIIDAAAQAEAALAAMNSSAAAYFSGVDKQQATQDYTTQGDAALDKFFGTASAAAGSAAISAAQASSDAARTAAASWRSAEKSIESAIENIRAGTTEQMDPAARYTLTKATLDAYTESALSGDVDAASKLAGAADDFLKASETGSTSQAQYLRDRVLAEAKLASVLASTQAQASVQDALASSASAAVSQLEAMNANLTGFSAQVYELLSKSYQGADRATAGSAAAGLAAMQANFESYFRDTSAGQVGALADGMGQLTRLAGDVGAYTNVAGDTSYFRAGESALDIAKRIPEFRAIWEKEFGLKLPAYSVGTSYVPETGPALLHKGEAVIPAAFNPFSGAQGSNEMLLELRALRQTNERLEARLASIEESNRDMATLLDNVTEGGNAMRSEVMA